MRAAHAAIGLALAATAGAWGGYWYARPPAASPAISAVPKADRKIVYYRDPTGAPHWSATPKKHESGRDYVPVFEDEDVRFDSAETKQVRSGASGRKILYYRNPMGLPDKSSTPKKDWMGMDYIPVYEGEDQDDATSIKISPERIQRAGVRTAPADTRMLVMPVRAFGTAKHDEGRLTVVTLRSEGYIEELYASRTGQRVRAGEPLFRVYSPEIQRVQVDLLTAIGAVRRGVAGPAGNLEGAFQRLRNLGIPESRIREVYETGTNPRTIDWPSPATGDIVEKRVVSGQSVKAGEELFRIADHTHLWVIADVAEIDLPLVEVGTRASVTFRAYPLSPIEGEVTFIYPELRAETRTGRVRIEIPNPDGRLKVDMHADVEFRIPAGEQPLLAVPADAVIDSGTRQLVLVSKGDGRFEPRPVRLGRRGEGYVEVVDGLARGEEVATSATFLIDSESNLKAALQSFASPGASK